MRYFGEKSLSSKASKALDVFWYLALAGSALAVLAAVMNVFSISFGDPVTSEIAKGDFLIDRLSTADKKDWIELRSLPLVWKVIIMPYFVAVDALFLLMIRQTRHLLANFSKDIVFNKGNVHIILKISKLNVGLSVLTVNITSFLISIMLFFLCDVLEKGAVLQDEHDLTI